MWALILSINRCDCNCQQWSYILVVPEYLSFSRVKLWALTGTHPHFCEFFSRCWPVNYLNKSFLIFLYVWNFPSCPSGSSTVCDPLPMAFKFSRCCRHNICRWWFSGTCNCPSSVQSSGRGFLSSYIVFIVAYTYYIYIFIFKYVQISQDVPVFCNLTCINWP